MVKGSRDWNLCNPFPLFSGQVPKVIGPLNILKSYMVKCGTKREDGHRGEIHELSKAFWKGRILGNKPS